MIQHILSSRKTKFKCCECIEITDDRLKKIDNTNVKTIKVEKKAGKSLSKNLGASEELTELIDDRFKEFERNTLKKIEDMILNNNERIDNTIKDSYSEAVKKNNVETQVKTAINEDRESRLKEVQDKESRCQNIIIHGLSESSCSFEISKRIDTYMVEELLKTINVKANVKFMYRLGKKGTNLRRPLKVVFGCKEERNEVLRNLSKLKDTTASKTTWYDTHISRDLTTQERKQFKKLSDEAKIRNEKELDYVWKVRDSLTKGPYLKRYVTDGISSLIL